MCSGAPGQNMPKSLQLWGTETSSHKQTGAVSLLAPGTLFDLSYLILFVTIYKNPQFFTKPKDKALPTPKMPPCSQLLQEQCCHQVSFNNCMGNGEKLLWTHRMSSSWARGAPSLPATLSEQDLTFSHLAPALIHKADTYGCTLCGPC